MDLQPFKLDIDELINDFTETEMTTLADMKTVWLSKKFSFIFEASPTTNLAFFMQSLYAHSIGYMISSDSLSQRLGGLYCLYCLYEVQPFKPPFKIYISLEELKRLRHLVIDAKKRDIKVVAPLVKKMLERNIFLFGSVDTNDSSLAERLKELTAKENAHVQLLNKKLFSDTRIEHFINMDLGTELEVDMLKKLSKNYAEAKEKAITGASEMVDVENIKHIAENEKLIGEVVEKSTQDWNTQKELYYKDTGAEHRTEEAPQQPRASKNYGEENENLEDLEQGEEDDGFGDELEEMLSME